MSTGLLLRLNPSLHLKSVDLEPVQQQQKS